MVGCLFFILEYVSNITLLLLITYDIAAKMIHWIIQYCLGLRLKLI